MKLKRIFACALALVFTASTIIARPASAADSAKNIDENQKIIYNKTNKKLTKSNGTCEKVYSDSTDEENAAEATPLILKIQKPKLLKLLTMMMK